MVFALTTLAFGAIAMLAPSAWAHGGDTTYVALTPNGATFDGLLTLDLVDAEGVLRVSRADWAEGRGGEVVSDYLVNHLSLSDGMRPCPIAPSPQSMQIDLKLSHLLLPFSAQCDRPPERLDVKFTIFFFDGLVYYIGIVRLEGPNNATLMFTKEHTSGTLSSTAGSMRQS